MHSTYGGARTSVHEENATWNIWLAQTLNILNKGKEPTFVTSNKKEVIDLTLVTYSIGDLVINWYVSNEISLPNHRYILLQSGDLQVSRLIYRDHKRTNWESYREDLKACLGFVPRVMHTVQDIQLATGVFQRAILRSYHQNLPPRVAVSPREIPCWKKRGEPPQNFKMAAF